MAGANDTAGEGGRAKGSSPMGLVIEFVAVLVVAAGAGAAMAYLQGPQASAASTPTPEAAGAAPQFSVVDLPPIVTNIASPADLWVRVEASIVVEGKLDKPPDLLAAEVATDSLAYLRTLTVGQIEGPIGLENMRQDLTDRAVVRSKGKVTELILKTLVLQ